MRRNGLVFGTSCCWGESDVAESKVASIHRSEEGTKVLDANEMEVVRGTIELRTLEGEKEFFR
jgi:hypothetical protein